MDKEQRQAIVKEYGENEADTGSTAVQIALLTARILELTEHTKVNKKDHSTKRGLVAMVNRRKKLLKYLNSENHAKYIEVTDRLGLRRK